MDNMSEELEKMEGIDCLEIDDINRGLAKLPSMIAYQARIVAEKRYNLERAKLELKVCESKCIVEAETTKKLTATDKKAIAQLKIEDQNINVIKASMELEIALIELSRYENYYISVRKQVYILEKELKTAKSYTSDRVPE